MVEHQTHGKLYEHILFERNPHWIDNRDEYIAKDDFYHVDGTPISAKIQLVGKGVYFADVHRMYQKEKDFLIYNAWYEGRPPKTIEGVKKALCEENIIKVDIQKWKKMWGNYESIKGKLNGIKNFDSEENKINPKRKTEYKTYCAEVKKLYCNHSAIIKITPKIGNKSKKRPARWQCYINNSTFRKLFL